MIDRWGFFFKKKRKYLSQSISNDFLFSVLATSRLKKFFFFYAATTHFLVKFLS